MLKTYKYRLYPNKEQSILLNKHFGCTRWLYNYALNKKVTTYTSEKKHLSRFDLQKNLPSLKKNEETSWLAEVNSQSLQSTLKNLDAAFIRFFREKKGFPKFKSKKTNNFSFTVPQSIDVNFDIHKVSFPKFKEGINFIVDRKFLGEIRQATVKKMPSGKYFIFILVNTEGKIKKAPKPKIEKAIGIDLGIKDFLIMSDGTKINNPTFLKKSLKKIKREQRWLSRKQKGSKNREKQRIVVAKHYEHITNQRIDFLQKLSSKLVCENQATTFCLEDLSVKNMMKNHNLAQAISDVSWSKFIRFMSYKCEWYGKNMLFIGRFDPSSKMCSHCGHINHELKLSDRVWICPKCGKKHDRDINAANNILCFAFHLKNKIGRESSEFTSVEKKVPLAKIKSSSSVKQKSSKAFK